MRKNQSDKEPPSIRITLYSDWFIQEVGNWADVNQKFPVDTSMLGEPYEPLRAFYLELISQNNPVTDVYVRDDYALIVKIGVYTIELPPEAEFTDLSWIIDADDDARFPDFHIVYNNEENRIFASIPDNMSIYRS